MPPQQGAEDGGVDVGGVGRTVPGDGTLGVLGPLGACVHGMRSDGPQWLPRRAVRHGLPPVPTRVMISQSARSSKMREVGIRTVVRVRPVMGCPARLTQ